MNQFSIQYIYTWKYQYETPFIALLNKSGGQEGKTGPVWGLAPVGGEGYKERV
jgi:hypothetical protein